VLGSGFTLAAVIGGTIGLGILRTPGEVATVVTNPWVFVSLWVLGGLTSLLCAVVYAELIAMTPRSGGTYALVRRAYGPFPGFVIGWVDWLSFVGDIALKAVVVVEFAAMLYPATRIWQTPLAIMVSSVFAALQLRGIALGAKIQQVAAAALALIVVGFTLALVFAESMVGDATSVPATATGLGAWSLVFASIIYTYDGWDYPAYFGGEIKGGGGAVARTLIKGVVVLTLLYVFLAAALAFKVPLASLAGKELALASALEMAVSPLASTVVLVVAIVMLLAHQNLMYMSTPRILQAMAVDGLFVRRAGKISKGGNPIFAVVLSWGFSVGLILIGGFHFLLHLLIFFSLGITVVLIAGVLILRVRQPDADRPYRVWGHPWSTYACLIFLILLTLFQAARQLPKSTLPLTPWFLWRYRGRCIGS
jgi:APA family basic amino acid/polyamine antiporter